MFFVICFENLPELDDTILDVGSVRVFGYFKTFEEAEQALNNNVCDMHEYYYDYAVVEEITCGIHPVVKSKHYFEFNKEKNGFFEIKTPESLKKFFTISFVI